MLPSPSKGTCRIVFLLCFLLALSAAALAHKSPPESYALEGTTMLRYTQKPLLPAVGDEVRFRVELIPRGEEPLSGEYAVDFTVYADESFTEWHGDVKHEHERIIALGSHDGEEISPYLYEGTHVFDTPGNYHLEVHVEHDGETLSEQHQMVLVEPRSPGPVFWVWLAAILVGVLLGAKVGVW